MEFGLDHQLVLESVLLLFGFDFQKLQKTRRRRRVELIRVELIQ